MLEAMADTVVRQIVSSDDPIDVKADYVLTTVGQQFVVVAQEAVDEVLEEILPEVRILVEDGVLDGPVEDLLRDMRDLAVRKIQRKVLTNVER